MRWQSTNALVMVVYEKYSTEYWGDLPSWIEYLKDIGIVRVPGKIRPKGEVSFSHILIECPWSVHNSVTGCVKHYMLIPEEMAKKIVFLGTMPSSPFPP